MCRHGMHLYLVFLILVPVLVVLGEVRYAGYHKTGELVGSIGVSQPSDRPSSTLTCAKSCTTTGCDGFSVSVREDGAQYCLLTTDSNNLPEGRWTLYTNNLPLERWTLYTNTGHKLISNEKCHLSIWRPYF